jgi:hypothetical protein
VNVQENAKEKRNELLTGSRSKFEGGMKRIKERAGFCVSKNSLVGFHGDPATSTVGQATLCSPPANFLEDSFFLGGALFAFSSVSVKVHFFLDSIFDSFLQILRTLRAFTLPGESCVGA